MIRIAYVVHSLRPGGIERSVTRIVNQLDSGEFCPWIICLDTTGPAAEWLEREVPIVEIQKKPGNDLLAVRRFAKCLRENKIDIIQSHNWGTLVESIIASRLSKTPVHIHAERGTVLGQVEAKGTRHWLRAKAMSKALTRVDRVISNSYAVAKRVEDRSGYPANRIQIIPNGVPDLSLTNHRDHRARVRHQIGIPQDAIVIGSVGRLVEVKGFDLALAAFSKLASKRMGVHLVLVGDGPEEQALRMLAHQLEITSAVHFVGHQHDVRPWLASFDIYLNASRSEGMSQSVIEAMSAGLPIVATDVGDNRRTLGPASEAAGICIPPLDPTSTADALFRLASDSAFRDTLARMARQRHQQFYSEQKLKENNESLYRSLLPRPALTS